MSSRVTIRYGLERLCEAEESNQRSIKAYLRDEKIRRQQAEQYHSDTEKEEHK